MGLTKREVGNLSPAAQKTIEEQLKAQGVDLNNEPVKQGKVDAKAGLLARAFAFFGPGGQGEKTKEMVEPLKHIVWAHATLKANPECPVAVIKSLEAAIAGIEERIETVVRGS